MLQELVSFGRRGRNGKPVTAVGSLAHRGSETHRGASGMLWRFAGSWQASKNPGCSLSVYTVYIYLDT